MHNNKHIEQFKVQGIKHLAIIMDGNGRWAQERSHSRIWGHVRGTQVVSEIIESAFNFGIESLTLYAFSTENWSRPKFEVLALMRLLKKFIAKESIRILKNNICFKMIGDYSNLSDDIAAPIRELEKLSSNNSGMKLNLAFNYGSRSELINSINCFIERHPGEKISSQDLENNLMTSESGDVDLLIRTGGDSRISNFLLWQIAYAELYFVETKWPDFTEEILKQILQDVSFRERRFGGVGTLAKNIGESAAISKIKRAEINNK